MSECDRDTALNCPICMERYSDIRYPIAPYCGHSICKECGDKRKSNQCVLCMQHCFYDVTKKASPWTSDKWKKNFAVLDLVHLHSRNEAKMKSVEKERNEWKSKLESAVSVTPNNADLVKCSSCKIMEKKERMNICGTCAHKANAAWKKKSQEEILHAIVCGQCFLKEHSGHKLVDYVIWQQGKMLSSVVSEGKSAVSSVNEMFNREVDKGRELLRNWNEAVGLFSSAQLYCSEQAPPIARTLKKESDLVARFSEECLPVLRKYCDVLTESAYRLRMWKKSMDMGKIDIRTSYRVELLYSTIHDTSASSQVDIMKRGFEQTIRKLEQKLEVNEKKLKELSAAVEKKTFVFNQYPLNCSKSEWHVGPARVDLLQFSVSHPMTLVAIEMYGAVEETEAIGNFTICSSEGDTLISQVYPLWYGRGCGRYSHMVTLADPVNLSPQKKYVVKMSVDRETAVYHGCVGTKKIMISPGQVVTFVSSDCGTNGTNDSKSQFAGLHFLVGHV